MVSSEDLLAFIKEQTTLEVTRTAEGDPEFQNDPLTGPDLAAALKVVGDLVAIEYRSLHEEAARAAFEAKELRDSGVAPGGSEGHGNYN